MIIVDSSVWIDHFAAPITPLQAALDADMVMIHPFVIGEMACGNLKNRQRVLEHMQNLYPPVVATHQEVLTIIEQRQLMGRGIGYIDMHLLASTLLTDNARLWTHDRRLHQAAAELGIAYTTV